MHENSKKGLSDNELDAIKIENQKLKKFQKKKDETQGYIQLEEKMVKNIVAKAGEREEMLPDELKLYGRISLGEKKPFWKKFTYESLIYMFIFGLMAGLVVAGVGYIVCMKESTKRVTGDQEYRALLPM